MQKKQEPTQLVDYIAVLRRRKRMIALTIAFFAVGSVVLAFVLPVIYRSGATILIESQEIPEQFVATTVNSALQERVQGITLRVLTHENLLAIAEKLQLYPEDRAILPPSAIVGRMRNDTSIEIVNYQASGAESAKRAVTTIAIKVSFDSDSPLLAKQAASELSNLFLQENRSVRSERAAEVASFLAKEGDKLRTEIADLEGRLAEFKQKHVDELPELADLNLRLFEQTEASLQRTQETIRSLENRMLTLNSQLSITDPYKEVFTDTGRRVQTSQERLSVLLAEYLRLSSNYAQDHPDVVKLRREIQSLEGQIGGGHGVVELVSQLKILREQLETARRKYSDRHPDVKKLMASVADVEIQLRKIDLPSTAQSDIPPPVRPDNPTYVTLKTQLDTVTANLQAENAQAQTLSERLAKYSARLQQTPAVEREYLLLTRDYDNAVKKYNDLRAKQLEAELGLELERDSKAERLTLVEPARIPSSPESPNRRAIIMLGFALGMVGGLGNATLAEYFDNTVRGVRGVLRIFEAPPIATIPYIMNKADARRRRRRMLLAIAALAAVLALIAAVSHLLVMPLAELWPLLMERIGVEVSASN